jgi:hypothetical protein
VQGTYTYVPMMWMIPFDVKTSVATTLASLIFTPLDDDDDDDDDDDGRWVGTEKEERTRQ